MLEQEINTQIKDAMKSKDTTLLRSLRGIKSALLVEKTKTGGTGEVSKEDETRILQKLAKQRRDSLEIYEQQGRDDLAVVEREELEVIERFLPAMMGADEVRTILEGIAKQVGATGPQDMGKMMGAAMGKLRGKADGKLISSLVKEILAG